MNDSLFPQKSGRTGIRQRFTVFAVCHVTYSLLCIAARFCTPVIWLVDSRIWWIFPLILMGAYFPLGVFAAWFEAWTPPQTLQEKVFAVALPTAAAWGWVVVVLIGIWTEKTSLFWFIVAVSFLFAAPSSFSMLYSVSLWMDVTWENGMWSFAAFGLAVGILPPLLFALGSFWQAGRQERRKEGNEDGRAYVETDPSADGCTGGQTAEGL